MVDIPELIRDIADELELQLKENNISLELASTRASSPKRKSGIIVFYLQESF